MNTPIETSTILLNLEPDLERRYKDESGRRLQTCQSIWRLPFGQALTLIRQVGECPKGVILGNLKLGGPRITLSQYV